MSQKLGKLQQQWIDALRSGNYKQGKSKLFDENEGKYCCLGVCEHAVANGVEKGVMNFSYLSSETRDLLHFHSTAGTFVGETKLKGKMNLAEANDYGGATFEEIADFIEQNPQAVFFKEA